MTSDPGAAAPTCPRHPDRVSYVRCQRCGRPACPECQRPASVGIQCVDCVREAASQRRPIVNRLGFTSAYGTPYVTYGLIALNVLAYVYGTVAMGTATWQDAWGLWTGLSPAELAMYSNVGDEWYRWISSGFVHFGLLHLGMNMLVLFQFGTQLEPILGRVRFAALYLASLLGGSLVATLIAPSVALHGGASGAIFGLIAAYAVVLSKLRLDYRSLLTTAGLWLVLGFVIPNISWQGHLGGAVAGALTMLAMLHWVERRPA
ncbi:rhomboid family intramembrane serine protease [Demequina subtropica]|uniref:rhomboid family intramembrane serine protease n=1 Tax=Demequina subtropica TaxID=1638989 RepID=UPI00078533EF|nr:rhomboid family intramembrane serine protease [Demequina subtropica]